MDILNAYRELGSYRAAARLCRTTDKTVTRVVEQLEGGGPYDRLSAVVMSGCGRSVCYLHLLDEEGRMPEPRVKLRRVYDLREMEGGPGRMVLVDGVWPRGIRKEKIGSALWLPELAPSDALREWFGHRPDRWEEFRRRYREELAQPERMRLLDELARMTREEPLTLLFGARDRLRNQAAVIAEALEERLT